MSKRTIQMRIYKYLPKKLYGFAINSSDFQVFFHLGQFKPLVKDLSTPPPPPILGEPVLVTYYESSTEGKAPKAISVERMQTPKRITGIVDSYDNSRGYGFIVGEDGKKYHLHNSEILNGRYPLQGDTVKFYTGLRQGKPRACHIEVVR